MWRRLAIGALWVLGCGSSSRHTVPVLPDAGAAEVNPPTNGDVGGDAGGDGPAVAPDRPVGADGGAIDGPIVDVRSADAPTPAVRLDPPSFAFPKTYVPPGPAPLALPMTVFTVTNLRDGPVGPLQTSLTGRDILDFAIVDDACKGKNLAVQATCQMGVRFNPGSRGQKEAYLAVDLAGASQASSWLTGTAIAPAQLSMKPATRDFGTLVEGQVYEVSFSLENTGSEPTGPVMVALAGPGVDTQEITSDVTPNCQKPLAAGADCGVIVIIRSNATPGPKRITVRVSASPGGSVQGVVTGTVVRP
jgi:hypothetical protein